MCGTSFSLCPLSPLSLISTAKKPITTLLSCELPKCWGGKPLDNWSSLWHYIIFQGSVKDWQQMYDFLLWTCICSTCGEGRDAEEKEMERENRNERSQMVANYVMLGVKVRTKELITAWRTKHSPERHPTHLPPSLCLVEESGFRDNWKQSKRGGGGAANT